MMLRLRRPALLMVMVIVQESEKPKNGTISLISSSEMKEVQLYSYIVICWRQCNRLTKPRRRDTANSNFD